MLFRSNDTATTEIYTTPDTLSLHDALPISLIAIGAAVVAGLVTVTVLTAGKKSQND